MSGALILMSAGRRPVTACSVSGTLSASAATSTVTSLTRTVTVPSGNSGTLRFDYVVINGVALQVSVNGGAWQDVTEDSTFVFADGNSIQVRATGLASLDQTTFDLVDHDTSTLLEAAVTLART